MKKFFILSLVVAFLFLGAQVFASPPIKPPVEGFIISSFTEIDCVGDVSESEKYDWTYFEGTGMLKNRNTTLGDAANWALQQYAALRAIDPAFWPSLTAIVNSAWNRGTTPEDLTPAQVQQYVGFILGHVGDAILIQDLGFQEGAQIAYQQDFTATKGSTFFKKNFKAVSHTNTTDKDNLVVDKTINYDDEGDGVAGDGTATHLEKVAMNVVSVGSKGGDIVAQATSLLQLCPWATGNNGGTPGYPPTNEGIAAASEFNVTKINFKSSTKVNTVNNPALAYNVTANGEGNIKAGFAVDLWEGREGDVWSTYQPHQPWFNLIQNVANLHGTNWGLTAPLNLHDDPVWVQEKEPFLASRTTYTEHASATGVWKFTKNVSYESKMPGGTPASTIPINQVP